MNCKEHHRGIAIVKTYRSELTDEECERNEAQISVSLRYFGTAAVDEERSTEIEEE